MQDFTKYLDQPDGVLVEMLVRVLGELATAHEELGSSRVQYENAYVRTMMASDGSVAEREREARANALHLRVSVLELEARVEMLRLEADLLRYLRSDPPHAQ